MVTLMKIKGAVFALSALAGGFALCEAKAKNGNLDREPDFLLILGCRVRGSEPEQTLLMRAEAAARFLNEHKNTIAICCGGIVHEDQTVSEAAAIQKILTQNAVEKERILLEDKSQTTFENFLNAKAIIDSLGLKEQPVVAFLSSEFHLMRASFIARLCGVKVKSVPAPSPRQQRAKNYVREALVFPLLFQEYFKKGMNKQ